MLVVLVSPTVNPDCAAVLRGLFAISGVRVGLVTHVPSERLPEGLAQSLAAHYRVDSTSDVEQVAQGLSVIQEHRGPIGRLLGFVEMIQVQLAVLRERFGIPGMMPDVAQRFRDKNQMKEVLGATNLPVARQSLIQSSQDAVAFAARVGWPIILKPLAGVGSQSTVRVSSPAGLQAALERFQPNAKRPLQAEAFVTGPERTFETVVVNGEPVWCSQTLYLDRPLDILENPWKQWSVLFPRETMDAPARAFLATNVAAIRALGLSTGISHMEWFLGDAGPVIGEVGARPPGARFMQMIGFTYDEDLWSRWAELEVMGVWRPLPPRKYAVGCAFFRAQGGGERIRAIEGLDGAQAAVGRWVIDRKLPEIGAHPRSSYEGDGYAVVRHPETEVVKDALLTLISTVRVYA